MKGRILLALIVCLGLVSVTQGQESRPVEERVRPSGRASAAEPDSPAMTIVLSQENHTAEPRLVKFGGVLNDSMGRPLSGEVEVTFALYKQEADEEPLWKETQKLELDKQGGYTALIGATQPGGVPADLFRSDEARWLGAQVQGEPQRPRILLVSVPYALKAVEAEKLGGKSASDFVLSESLGEQVRQVIQAQGEVTTQTTSTGIAQQGQTKANSTLSPQMTPAGPTLPPSTFSGTTSNQVVLVQQQGTGAGLLATSPQNNALAGESTGGNGVFGQTAALDRSGVVGFAASTGGHGVVGIATSASSNQNGVLGLNFGAGPGVAGIANATSGFNDGVFGQTASNEGAGVSGNAVNTSGNPVGVVGTSAGSNGGIGVWGVSLATSGYNVGVRGDLEVPNSSGAAGLFLAFSPTSVAGQFTNFSGQGLLLQGLSGPFNGTQKEVFSVDVNGNLQISGNLTVNGTKSSTARLQNGREVALYAVESPENWFEDFGSAELRSGVAWVPLDALFGEATNAAVTYHVFLSPNGDSNGVYVARKTPAGFEVREHGGGDSNVAFDYRIVVRRRGYEAIRMAEVQRDTRIQELWRQHFAELRSSGAIKRAGAVRIAPPPAIPLIPPRPSVPALPKLNVPQAPRPR